jgi:hypothetical protein
LIFKITELHIEIKLTMDIPSVVLQFRLTTAHLRCAFKKRWRLCCLACFAFRRSGGSWGSSPEPMGGCSSWRESPTRGDLRGAIPPLIYFGVDPPFDPFPFHKSKTSRCGRQNASPAKMIIPQKIPLTNAPFGGILIITEYVRAKIAARELCR